MKKLVLFRLGLCAIELIFGIVLLWMEAGFERKYPYFGVSEPVTYGSFTIIQGIRLICAPMLEIVPNDIDLVWTRTAMVMYTVSAWVQVVERKDLNRAGLGFGAALILLFDQTVFFLNHPIPAYLLEPYPELATTEEEKAIVRAIREERERARLEEQSKALLEGQSKALLEGQSKALLEEKGTCVRRTVIS